MTPVERVGVLLSLSLSLSIRMTLHPEVCVRVYVHVSQRCANDANYKIFKA